MTVPAEQLPYVRRDPALGLASLARVLPITLASNHSVSTSGLVDSAAAINVLPYTLGLQLGFDWNQQTNSVELSGNLASVDARVIVVTSMVGTFAPVRLAAARATTALVRVAL